MTLPSIWFPARSNCCEESGQVGIWLKDTPYFYFFNTHTSRFFDLTITFSCPLIIWLFFRSISSHFLCFCSQYKRRHIMLIFRFRVLFLVATRLGLHALVPKKHFSSVSSQCCSSVFPLCLKRVVSLRSTQSPLIGQLTHANVWHGDVVWCHEVKELNVGLLMRRLRSSVFCGREKLLFGVDFRLFNLKDRLHAQEPM